MSKPKKEETKREDFKENFENVISTENETGFSMDFSNTAPKRTLYQVAVVNFSRNEEVTPIYLKIAASDAEAESLVRAGLSVQWQTDDLEFFVKPFMD